LLRKTPAIIVWNWLMQKLDIYHFSRQFSNQWLLNVMLGDLNAASVETSVALLWYQWPLLCSLSPQGVHKGRKEIRWTMQINWTSCNVLYTENTIYKITFLSTTRKCQYKKTFLFALLLCFVSFTGSLFLIIKLYISYFHFYSHYLIVFMCILDPVFFLQNLFWH